MSPISSPTNNKTESTHTKNIIRHKITIILMIKSSNTKAYQTFATYTSRCWGMIDATHE